MFKSIEPDFLHSFINIGIIAFGTLALVFVLRGVFKVAWKIIKFILILVGLLVIVGSFAGWINISF